MANIFRIGIDQLRLPRQLKSKQKGREMESISYVFIDRQVSDYQHLMNSVKPGSQVVLLESDRDGMTQISEALQDRRNVKEIHLVAHGSPGSLYLGNTQVNLANLEPYANHLKQWRQAITRCADILIYGCRVAEQGWADLLQPLSTLTGANVAASSRDVGQGRWDLDRQIGNITASLAFTPAGQQSYAGVLSIGYALRNNTLIAFDTTNPDATLAPVSITGLTTGQTLVGIDFRPQNGKLYGLATNGTGSVQLYAISTQTGVATAVGAAVSASVPITGTNFGFDFNPTVDRIRVVTDTGLNFRINPNTGALVDSDPGTAGVQLDGNVNGATTTVDATAYTNNSPNATATTQYTLDAVNNALLIQNPPNGGTQTSSRPITLNGAPLDFTAVNGFDIPAGVNVTTANSPATGQGFAALTVGNSTGLYAIELSTGAATLVGSVGTGTDPVQGFAIQSEAVPNGVPVIGLDTTGNLVRFNSATPGTVTNVAVSGLAAGETLVGIDFRPATGQLFGLAVNATANTGTVVLLDPQTGAATAIGTPGSVALVDGSGNPIDLPATGYGFDFNPTVDRIRVVTSSGLNFRLNPNTGTAVDGDNGQAADSVTGVNPDGPISGSTTSVDATAYTNSFAQGTGTTATTQYTLDSASDRLFIQNPPNGGPQTSPLPITLNGNRLDFSAVNGFDIPSSVRVTTSNSPASGQGLAALTVGGTTGLYKIDLSTGAATLAGTVGSGTTQLAGLTVADAPTGAIGFDAANYTVTENGTAIEISLVRTGGSAGALTVDLAATGGTATGGTATTGGDYSGLPLTVAFADGQTRATARLTITDDTSIEGDETVLLGLTNPTGGAVLAGQDTATLTITDNESQPIRGTGAGQTLRGTALNDTILGLGGNDRLLGLAGDDSLNGGRGQDTLVGAAGADRFVYAGPTQRAALKNSLLNSLDRINGFSFAQGDRFLLDFDNNLTTANQPRRLFNAGDQTNGSLEAAVRSAYDDKNQTRRGDQRLGVNEAVFFNWRNRTYLAVNNDQTGFQRQSDLLVNAPNLNFRAGDANAGALAVNNYFA